MIDIKNLEKIFKDSFKKSPVFFKKDIIIPALHYLYGDYTINNFKQFPGSYIENGILYEYNSDGHRCDEFTKVHDGKHVLFAGCSETFGVSSTAETTWPYFLHQKINEKEKTSGFFRLGYPGGGFQLILKGVMNYINLYGKPDELFILFPHLERRVEFDDNVFKNIVHAPLNSPKEIDDRYRYSIEEYAMWIFEMKERMITFEEYCSSNNIKLYWSFFMNGISSICENISEFINYVSMQDDYNMHKWIYEKYSEEELKIKDI